VAIVIRLSFAPQRFHVKLDEHERNAAGIFRTVSGYARMMEAGGKEDNAKTESHAVDKN